MAKERLFDLPETKGVFQIRGLVTGHDKDNFYKEIMNSTTFTVLPQNDLEVCSLKDRHFIFMVYL